VCDSRSRGSIREGVGIRVMPTRTDRDFDSFASNCLCSWGLSAYPSFRHDCRQKDHLQRSNLLHSGDCMNTTTARHTRTKTRSVPKLGEGMAVFHKRVNQDIRLESSTTLQAHYRRIGLFTAVARSLNSPFCLRRNLC